MELTTRGVVDALDVAFPGVKAGFEASVPPGSVAIAVNALARHAIAEGLHLGMRFREWAPRQVARFGEAVRPVLRRAWEQARNVLAQARKAGADAVQMAFGGAPRQKMTGYEMPGAQKAAASMPSAATEIAKAPEPKKGISAFDAAKQASRQLERAFTPYLEAVSKFKAVRGGIEVGKDFAERLTAYLNHYERGASLDFAEFWKSTRGLAKREHDNFVRMLYEGLDAVPEASAQVKTAAREVRQILDDIARRAKEAGVFVGYLENYFPRKFEKKWEFEQQVEMEAIKAFEKDGGTVTESTWLDKNGRALGEFEIAEKVNDAAAKMAKVHYDVRTYNRKQHNLEYRRSEDGRTDWRRDLGVLGEYILEANRRIAEANELGPKLERVREMLYQMTPERGERDYAMTGLLRMTGREQRTWMHRGSDVARKFSAVMKLGHGAWNQIGSISNTVRTAGVRPALKAISEVGVPGTKAYKEAYYNALRNGALFHNISNEILTTWGTGPSQRASWNVPGKAYDVAAKHMWGVPYVDAYMRVVASSAAKHAIPEMVKARDWKGLEKMALDPEQARNLAAALESGRELPPVLQSTLEAAAKSLSDKTQYRTGVADLPLWSTSPAGRLLTQFMPFMYKHGRATYKLAKNREFGALARYMAAAAVIGEGAASLKAMAQGYGMAGEPPNDQEGLIRWSLDILGNRRVQIDLTKPGTIANRALQNFMYAGGVGIYQTAFERAARMRTIEDVFGPAVGDLGKVIRAVGPTAGGNLRPAGKAAIEMLVPGFGAQIGTEFLRDPRTEAKSPAWWPGWIGRARDAATGDTDLLSALAGGTRGGAKYLSPTRQSQREYVLSGRESAAMRKQAEELGLTPSGLKPRKPKAKQELWREKVARRKRANERLRRRLEATGQ